MPNQNLGLQYLPTEAGLRIFLCLTIPERIAAAGVCTNFAYLSKKTSRFHPPDVAKRGTIPEADAALVEFALDMMRFGVYSEGLARISAKSRRLLVGPGHTSALSRDQETAKDLLILNQVMYENMVLSRKDTLGAYEYLVECCRMNKARNPSVPFGPDEVAPLREWTNPAIVRRQRYMIIAECPDGAIFVSMTAISKVYVVLGLGRPIRELVEIPAIVDATLLPVAHKYITIDGVIQASEEPPDASDIFNVAPVVWEALSTGNIYVTHTVIPWRKVEASRWHRFADTDGKAPPEPTPILPAVSLSTEVARWLPIVTPRLTFLKALPRRDGYTLILQRMDLKTGDAPGPYQVIISSNFEGPVGEAYTAAFIPTPAEIIQMIWEVVYHSRVSEEKCYAPCIVILDCEEVAPVVEALLAPITTIYQRPDTFTITPLDVEVARARSGPTAATPQCALCGAHSSPTLKLQSCARCKKVLYCNRDHQKAHWKTHKPKCTPEGSASAAATAT